MKLIARQKIWLALMVLLNLAVWIIPSDVVELIARDRHTLLGRYSREHFYANLGIAVFTIISFYVDWSTGVVYRRRWFQVLAGLAVFFPAAAVADFLLRSPQTDHYVKDEIAYHRPPNERFGPIVFEDKPQAVRTFPHAPSGFGAVSCVLTTDRRGYRNREDRAQCDVVALGDSFTEGSSVSDEHVWPARLEALSGARVCNLGMSGYDPLHYLESLKAVGLELAPKIVLCMIYEGNDFRSAKTDEKRKAPSLSKRLEEYMGRSPVLNGLDNFLIGTFAPVRARAEVRGVEVLDWLPLSIPAGPAARPYAFEPKQLRDLFESREEFAQNKHWLNPRSQLQGMKEACRGAGAELVVLFAPTKAHVALPMVADGLPGEKVRAFMRISYKKELPEGETLLAQLVERADAREQVVGEYCARESIHFFSLTPALRAALAAGRQAYYTYDQHWSPEGHAVVAEAVNEFLRQTGEPATARAVTN